MILAVRDPRVVEAVLGRVKPAELLLDSDRIGGPEPVAVPEPI